MQPFVLDIETAPLPLAHLESIMPDFDPAGNLKDPEKIKADIAAKRAAWLDKAALSPETGRILCAGMLHCGNLAIAEGEEKDILATVAGQITLAWGQHIIVGHNLFGFDAAFILRRLWANGIKGTAPLFEMAGRRYNNCEWAFDTMLAWSTDTSQRISLDRLAKFLGVGEKKGNGKDFAALYAKDRESALAYLENDLRLAEACFGRMTK